MSEAERIPFKCPKCGKESEPEIQRSVNTVTEPEAAERVISGDLFSYQCPGCGTDVVLTFPLLYQDLVRRTTLQIVTAKSGLTLEDSVKDAIAERETTMAELRAKLPEADADFGEHFRVVTTPDDLREKAMILKAGLDDRYVEIIKSMTLSIQKQDGETTDVASNRFMIDDENKNFIVYFDENGEPIGEDTFPKEFYDAIVDDMKLVDEPPVGWTPPGPHPTPRSSSSGCRPTDRRIFGSRNTTPLRDCPSGVFLCLSDSLAYRFHSFIVEDSFSTFPRCPWTSTAFSAASRLENSSSVSVTFHAPRFSRIRSFRLEPGIGTTFGYLCSIQASVICAGVACFSSANRFRISRIG